MDITNIIDLAAMVGAIIYTAIGYFDKKRSEPKTAFDLTYAFALVGAIYGALQVVEKAGLQLTIFGIVGAFWIGFSFSAGLAKINTKIPIELPIGAVQSNVRAQDIIDLKNRIAEQDVIIKKLQEKPPGT